MAVMVLGKSMLQMVVKLHGVETSDWYELNGDILGAEMVGRMDRCHDDWRTQLALH